MTVKREYLHSHQLRLEAFLITETNPATRCFLLTRNIFIYR